MVEASQSKWARFEKNEDFLSRVVTLYATSVHILDSETNQ